MLEKGSTSQKKGNKDLRHDPSDYGCLFFSFSPTTLCFLEKQAAPHQQSSASYRSPLITLALDAHLVVTEEEHSGGLVVFVVGDAEVVRPGRQDGVVRLLRRQVRRPSAGRPSRLHGRLADKKTA